MALGSFFCPVIGLAVGAASIVLGFNAIQTLRAHHVEEGRGSAIAAMVIGALGLFAQAFYTIYLMNEGLPLLGP
jgi:hypothetical protein